MNAVPGFCGRPVDPAALGWRGKLCANPGRKRRRAAERPLKDLLDAKLLSRAWRFKRRTTL